MMSGQSALTTEQQGKGQGKHLAGIGSGSYNDQRI